MNRAYDQHGKSLNLLNLIDTIDANLHLFAENQLRQRLKDNPFVDSLAANARPPARRQLAIDRRLVTNADQKVKTLTKWRNNVFAHQSADEAALKELEKFPLRYHDVEVLFRRGMRIVNRCSSLFDRNTVASRIVGHGDYLSLLKSVRADLDQRERELTAQLRAAGYRRDGTLIARKAR